MDHIPLTKPIPSSKIPEFSLPQYRSVAIAGTSTPLHNFT